MAGPDAAYFGSEQECAQQFDRLLTDKDVLTHMKKASQQRHEERFTWEKVLGEYESLLAQWQ